MKKMIITADDYGMSKAVNEAIDAGIAAGLITSTNVMANMPFYKEAKKLKEIQGISVGIHWVLSCGRPILPPESIPTLVTPAGDFYPYSEFRTRYRQKKISHMDIKKELTAQYVCYREVLGEPDYWNTHQNVHVDFGIYSLFVDIARELGIHKMRSHQRIYVIGSSHAEKLPLYWRVLEPVKSRMLTCWQENAHKKGIASPEGLIVLLGKEDSEDLEYVFGNIQWKHHQIAEYVIHPATQNDSPFFGRITGQRIAEYRKFTSDETRQIIEKNGIVLCNYAELVQS